MKGLTVEEGEIDLLTVLKEMLRRGFKVSHGAITILRPFQSLILYSTSANSKDGLTIPAMADYLVNSAGFSQAEAASIVTKVSTRFRSTPFIATHVEKSSKNAELVVDFLKDSGFSATHIRRVVSKYPFVLLSKVEKTLEPKIRVFQEAGLRGSDLGLAVSQNPHVLSRSSAFSVTSLDQLKSLLGSKEELISFLLKTKSSYLLCYGFIKNLPGNMLLLKSYGVPKEKNQDVDSTMADHNTQRLEYKLKLVEEKFGIPRTSAMFTYGISAVITLTEDKLESSIQVLRRHGWTETEISMSLRKNPSFVKSSEKSLVARLVYFMEELGCRSDYLASRPALLTYSLEKRVMPRIAVIQALKGKQLLKKDAGLSTLLYYGKSKFFNMYLLPSLGELPQVYEECSRPHHHLLLQFICSHLFTSSIRYSTAATIKDGTTTNLPPMLEFLTKSKKPPPLLSSSAFSRNAQQKKPERVLNFYRRSGFEETQIKRLITCFPKAIRYDVEKTLEPKIRFFQELGLRGSDLGLVISLNPHVLCRSLEDHIVPSFESLKSIVGSNEAVR
ncbi:hypothetical protein V2J09_012201 [Rumex salicifolius]